MMVGSGAGDKKALKGILDDLASLGWRLEQTKKGVMAYPPDKALAPVLVHWTPSDHRAWPNMIATLKRSGYDWKANR